MHGTVVHEREAEYATRWAAGAWRGTTLETERGDRYQIVYEGRRGGGAGPDFRDAVLARADGSHVLGDVELHLRAGGWRAHGHESDPRYARVVLHVVFHPLAPGAPSATLLPAGGAAPIVVLGPRATHHVTASVPASVPAPPSLPCARLAARLPARTLRTLLLHAGRTRFFERADTLMREIAEAAADSERVNLMWTPPERVLWIHLAEALGYGRDRQTLRWAGERLTERADPDAPRQACSPLALLDATRLDALLRLRARWVETGPWEPLRRALLAGSARAAGNAVSRALRDTATGLSPARARIVTANVILPFAAASATLDGDAAPRERTLAVYNALPGLQSNTITRLMSRQLGMSLLPAGACAQQGLHYIWNTWCREKRCETCPMAAPAAAMCARSGAESTCGARCT